MNNKTPLTPEEFKAREKQFRNSHDLDLIKARRTAFVARFIVLREARRSKAHRKIELMQWDEHTSPEELAQRFRQAFLDNQDNMEPVDRDLRRALGHATKMLEHFIVEYSRRATNDFIGALKDYDYSNKLLFGHGPDQPKAGGWCNPEELERDLIKKD